MQKLSRRNFLKQGTVAAAAAGVVASMPALPGFLGGAESTAPAVESAVAGDLPAGAKLAGPIVAHVTDVSTGEVSVFFGKSQVVLHDPQLAARLFRAAQ